MSNSMGKGVPDDLDAARLTSKTRYVARVKLLIVGSWFPVIKLSIDSIKFRRPRKSQLVVPLLLGLGFHNEPQDRHTMDAMDAMA